MLQFNQASTEEILILTLTEKVSLPDPYYLFSFTHVLTKETVKFIRYSGNDASNFTERFNQFTINPAVLFYNKPIGEYHYAIYEQESATNTDTDSTGAVLEYGKLILNRATPFAFVKYNEPQTIKTYNG